MIFLKKYKDSFFILLSILLYFFFGYFLERTQFKLFVILWFLLFGSAYFLIHSSLSFKSLIGISIVFRLIFILAIPNLSQDFYRFIWDGRMIFNGFNPYLSLPETFIQQGNMPVQEAEILYKGMGGLNGSHYTNYPPLNQLNFLIAAIVGQANILSVVVVLRLQIILADLGILYFGTKLLKNLKLNPKNIFWYALNPFIIIELTGNLHFEPVMLFFLIAALFMLQKNKFVMGGVLLACSVSVKLIPLLFLPLFYQWFIKENWQKGIVKLSGFYLLILTTTIVLFLPFYSSEFIANYSNSVGLWFRNFEFNASFYYLFREIGFLFRGWNEIAIIGKITPILSVLFLIGITFFRKNAPFKNLLTAMLFGISFYYFTASTIHPWYLATLVLLSIFTTYKFPMLWSLVIVFSYQAYANTPWKENLWFVGLEYLVVYGFLAFEIFQAKKVNHPI